MHVSSSLDKKGPRTLSGLFWFVLHFDSISYVLGWPQTRGDPELVFIWRILGPQNVPPHPVYVVLGSNPEPFRCWAGVLPIELHPQQTSGVLTLTLIRWNNVTKPLKKIPCLKERLHHRVHPGRVLLPSFLFGIRLCFWRISLHPFEGLMTAVHAHSAEGFFLETIQPHQVTYQTHLASIYTLM